MKIADLTDPAIRSFVECISHLLPGFVVRTAQLRMIEAVARTLRDARDGQDVLETDGSNILLVAAGTGCGKTLGYSASAVVASKASGKQLIISSSTINLQQQLLHKDLPLLRQASPIPFRFALAKGRARYVCRAKIERVTASEVQGDLLSKSEAVHTVNTDLEKLIELAKDLAAGRWSGDRDELDEPLSEELWRKVTTDRNGCAGNRCPYFSECAFYIARAEVKSADVIIANHDLCIAALAMAPGSVLPDPSTCLYVFDECHSLPGRALNQNACRHLLAGALEWMTDASQCASKAIHGLNLEASLAAKVSQGVMAAAIAIGEIEKFASAERFRSRTTVRFKHGVLPEQLAAAGRQLTGPAARTHEALRDLRTQALEKAKDSPHLSQRLVADLGFYIGKLENLADTWGLMLREDRAGHSPAARWLEKVDGDVAVCAAETSSGSLLRKALWTRASASVLCSATLTPGGSFKSFLNESGLDVFPAVGMLELASPFNYASCAILEVPRMRSDPRNHDAHTDEIVARFPELIKARGVLILFGSRKQMNEVYVRIAPEMRAVVLMQGTFSKAEIIRRHRAAIDAGRPSIVFGLDSYREGIDLAGPHCEQVIVTKIGFSVPETPIAQARAEWVEKQGGSAFFDLVLPAAGVKLAQGVGRLIRTESDRGTVTVLDKRLATSRYGSYLMKGLPAFRLELFNKEDRRPT